MDQEPSRKSKILDEFQSELQNPDISKQEWENRFEMLKVKWGSRAAAFLDSIYEEKHRWAFPWTGHYFLAFKTGNSVSESAAHSVASSLCEKYDHAELVTNLIEHNTEQNNRDRRDRATREAQHAFKLLDYKDPAVKQCFQDFSQFITEKFELELQDSFNYQMQQISGSCWKVNRFGYAHTYRVVSVSDSKGLVDCTCLTRTNKGHPCRHVLCYLRHVGLPLYNKLYFNPRYEKRTFLPEASEIVFEEVALVDHPSDEEGLCNGNTEGAQFESSDATAEEVPTCCPQQPYSRGKKGRKQVTIYKQVLSAAETLASFVSTHRDTDLGTYVTNLISAMEAELRAGKLPVLQTTTTPGPLFQNVQSNQTVDDNTVKHWPAIGRPPTKRFLSAVEMPSRKTQQCRRPREGAQNQRPTATVQTCSVCHRFDMSCSKGRCELLMKFGKKIKPENYAWLISVDVPLTTDVLPQSVTKAAFQKDWAHVIVEHVCKDVSGIKYCTISSLDSQLTRTKHPLLYTMMALELWLNTKGKKKQLLLGWNNTTEIDNLEEELTSTKKRVMLKLRVPATTHQQV